MKIELRMTCAAALVASLVAGCAATDRNVKSAALLSAPDDSHCVTDTGNALPRAKCSIPGRSYSSTDIQLTGATTAGDALRLLDPTLNVHRW